MRGQAEVSAKREEQTADSCRRAATGTVMHDEKFSAGIIGKFPGKIWTTCRVNLGKEKSPCSKIEQQRHKQAAR